MTTETKIYNAIQNDNFIIVCCDNDNNYCFASENEKALELKNLDTFEVLAIYTTINENFIKFDYDFYLMNQVYVRSYTGKYIDREKYDDHHELYDVRCKIEKLIKGRKY